MKLFKRAMTGLLACTMTLSLAACGGAPAEKPTDKTVDPDAVTYQDSVTIGVSNDVTTLDPQGSNTDANMMVYTLVHDTLVEIDPKTGDIIPGLAETWKVSEDGCVFTFTLPGGVVFSDGTPCTASDVKFTYERAQESSFTKTKVDLVKDITVVDETHVQITISKPSQDFLSLLAHRTMSILSEKAVKADEFGYQIGTGVFTVEEWLPGDQISFIRSDSFRGTPAPTHKIIFKLIKEESSRLISLQTGDIDVCLDPLVTDLNYISEDPNLELMKLPNVVMLYIAINNTTPGLDNPHVRKAIAYATDKESMITVGYNGEGTVHHNFVNRGQFGLLADIPAYDYNIEKAKAEMALSGYKAGELNFEVIYNGSAKENIALVLQADMAKIGINLKLTKLETAALKGILNDAALKYQLCLYQFTDADGTDFTMRNMYGSYEAGGKLVKTGSNRCVMTDAKFNEMMDAALVELDPAVREKMYNDMELYLYGVCPIVPICTSMLNVGVKKGLDGVKWNSNAKHDYRFICLPTQ